MSDEQRVGRGDRIEATLRAKDPGSDGLLVQTQVQDGVVQFAGERQRPEIHTRGMDTRRPVRETGIRLIVRSADREECGAQFAVQSDIDVAIG